MEPKENYHGIHDRKPHHQGRRLDGRRFCHIARQCPDRRPPQRPQVPRGRPDYRVINKRTGFEIGAGWNRVSPRSGAEYVSIRMEAPEIGVIFGNLAPAPGGEDGKKVLLWNNPE